MGLQYLPAGKAALLITLNPVVTLLLAVWLFKERLNAIIGLGMAMAFCGAIIVISQGNPLHILQGQLGLGEWLILGCVACWVGYTLLGRWVMNGVDALSATAVTASFGALFLIVASLLVEGSAGVQAALHSGWSAWGRCCSWPLVPRPWPMPGSLMGSSAWVQALQPATSPWCRWWGWRCRRCCCTRHWIPACSLAALWRCWAPPSCNAGGAKNVFTI